MKTTKIELQEKDTALVFRDNGKLELFLRTVRDGKSVKPSDNELLTYVLSKLITLPGWVEEQVELYEKLGEMNEN